MATRKVAQLDLVGTAMGMATIPMVLLTAASAVAAVVLVVLRLPVVVLAGVALVGAGALIAAVAERVVDLLDTVAIGLRTRGAGWSARGVALLAGGVPMALIVGWQLATLLAVAPHRAEARGVWLLLWGYGVATGPWTLYATMVGTGKRTLCGIRAYAGHIACWLGAVALYLLDLSMPAAAALMALPTALPVTVGMLLATADRDALRNVRL